MIDFTWKIFSQTGNIETYLLLKELENETNHVTYYKENKKEIMKGPQL